MMLARMPGRGARRVSLVGLLLFGAGCRELPTEVSPVVEPQMAVVAASSTIDLKVVRFAGGTGSVLSSNGIPLAPGMLRPGESGLVRLLVNGQEQSIYVRELKGVHKDGSLRSIVVQFRYAVPSSGGAAAQLLIGQPRTTTDLAAGPMTHPFGNPLPPAAALPSSPQYLISTGIVGQATLAPDGFNPTYESNFTKYGDPKWSSFISKYGSAITSTIANDVNYYDRAYIYYAWWARTGNPEYWRRAAYLEVAYREKFLKAKSYNIQPHDLHIDGLEAHYLLTGDTASLTAVRKVADLYHTLWMSHIGSLTSKYNANRIQARVLDAYMTAARLALRSKNFDAASRQALGLILGTQKADGSYRFISSCQQQLNFQTGLLNEILVEYYEVIDPDPRIPTAIRKSLDFLWNTQWLPASGAFKYISGYCASQGTTKAAPDLNMLIVMPYGWYAKQTGLATYRTRGDQVFNEGVKRAYLLGEKHFNQNYRSSFHYLQYRR